MQDAQWGTCDVADDLFCQNLAPRGASDLEPLWLRIQHYQPNWRQKLTETVDDSVQCNRDSVVKSEKITQSWCYSHEISAQTQTSFDVLQDATIGVQ